LKIVYSDPKTGRSAQMELQQDRAVMFINKKIGEIIDGTAIGLTGYKLKITGGSDKSGFPLNQSVDGPKKTTLLERGSKSGKGSGEYRRMTVRGNTVSADTEQINVTIVEYGEKPIDEILPKKEKAEKKEEKAQEKA
jgi:small subunit ribosomal protein S6e